MQEIYFTSDTHYGHLNIVKGISKWKNKDGCRNFQTVEEMNQTLVDNINKTVKESDILYHLGDWSMGAGKNVINFAMQLKCKDIHLVCGNHDDMLYIQPAHNINWFSSVEGLRLLKIQQIPITLCHYALRTWYKQSKGAWMLYGHSHGNLPPIKIGTKLAKTMDVGIDTHPEFRPYHFDEIRDIMNNRLQSIPEDYAT